MLGMYKAVVGSLNAQIRLLGRDHDTVSKARASEIVHFKQTLSRTAVTNDDAHALYDELGKPDNPFTESERTDLGEAVALQCCSGRVPEASDTVGDLRQKCMYFFNYMPDGMWTSALDKNVSVDITLSQLASLGVHTLGLVKPCEQTARVITATAIVAKQLAFMPVQMQAKVKALKTAFTELRHIHKPIATFKTFPEHVADFVSVYPGRYTAAEPPMEPRIEMRAVLDMCRPDVMPCRKSASSLRLTAPSSSSSTHHMQPHHHYVPPFAHQHQQPPMQMNGDAFAQMFRCMMNFVNGQGAGDQQSSSSTPPADTIPGMQYFFQHGAPPACSTPPRVQPAETPIAVTPSATPIADSPSAASPAAIASDDVRKRVHEVLQAKSASAATAKRIRKSRKKNLRLQTIRTMRRPRMMTRMRTVRTMRRSRRMTRMRTIRTIRRSRRMMRMRSTISRMVLARSQLHTAPCCAGLHRTVSPPLQRLQRRRRSNTRSLTFSRRRTLRTKVVVRIPLARTTP
jgi:hypothetical protein